MKMRISTYELTMGVYAFLLSINGYLIGHEWARQKHVRYASLCVFVMYVILIPLYWHINRRKQKRLEREEMLKSFDD